ncbi:MAG: LysM peptidoglycan-binding domain-containing protein [Candidatus Binatia bacterium]
MLSLRRASVVVLLLVRSAIAETGASACAESVRGRLGGADPGEVCAVLLAGSGVGAAANVDLLFDVETQDLGDGDEALVFRRKSGGDALSARPSFHFVRDGERWALAFDGQGADARYATNRPKVNRRYQIERVVEANVPGLYRKREVETWFWNGSAYARAFTRVSIQAAKDAQLNGDKMHWNPETEEAYRKAGVSWTYEVKGGDTLSTISKRQAVPSAELARQNGIGATTTLRIGQKLKYESWRVNAR